MLTLNFVTDGSGTPNSWVAPEDILLRQLFMNSGGISTDQELVSAGWPNQGPGAFSNFLLVNSVGYPFLNLDILIRGGETLFFADSGAEAVYILLYDTLRAADIIA